MEKWQERLIKEYIDLQDREIKLRMIMKDHPDEANMRVQQNIMCAYLEILKVRAYKYGIDLEDEFKKTLSIAE